MSQEIFNPPIYSPDKLQKLQDALGEVREKVLNEDLNTGDHQFIETNRFETELGERVEYLRKKYGKDKAGQYALFHAFSGSDITPEIAIIAEDFPGEDSAEKFLTNLIERYK